jgi:hypothetical protein
MPEDHSVAILLWIVGIACGFVLLHKSVMAYDTHKAKVKRTLAGWLLTAVWTAVVLFGVWLLLSTIRWMWEHPMF